MALAQQVPIEQLLGQVEDQDSPSPSSSAIGGALAAAPDWWPFQSGGIGSSEIVGNVQITISWSPPSGNQLRAKFAELIKEWKRDTKFKSSLNDKVMHPSYLAIIGMGRDALPFIFSDLQRTRDHWLVALHAITLQEPASPNATFGEAVDAWIAWGKEQGYL